MGRLLAITLLSISVIANADESSSPLTPETYLNFYQQVTNANDAKISDKGNYLLVTSNQKFYAFTKPEHPGYPGYIEWKFVDGETGLSLTARGVHGANGEAFHTFEKQMNEIFVEQLKARLGND